MLKEVIILKEIVEKATVGLRDKMTHEIIAVYPKKVENLDSDTKKMVKDWYYEQGCANEETLLHCYVDVLKENEINYERH
jgi:hypothetical protein